MIRKHHSHFYNNLILKQLRCCILFRAIQVPELAIPDDSYTKKGKVVPVLH
jgi:hypothetical protein